MEPLFAIIILGLIQGLLEWIPISSQGNIILIAIAFLGLKPVEALNLSIYLHVGTGLAALIYFKNDVVRILRQNTNNDKNFLFFLIVSTMITGIIGFPIYLLVKTSSYYGEIFLAFVGLALIVTGLLQKFAHGGGLKTSNNLGIREGVLMGLVQGFSVIPGLSRSGLTVSVFLIRNFSGEDAFYVSFLMSIPAIFTAALGLFVFESFSYFEPIYLVAIIASFLSALISIDIILKLVRQIRFWILCILLGALTLLPQISYFL